MRSCTTAKPPELGGGADTISNWLPPFGRIRFEILGGNQPVGATHLLDQQAGRLTAIEIVGAKCRDAFERCGQLFLNERSVGAYVAEVVAEVRLVAEPVIGIPNEINEHGCRNKAVPCQRDSRLDQFTPGQAAEALVRLPEPGYRPRHRGGLAADQRGILDDVAVIVEIHVLVGSEWRLFAIVEERSFPVLVDHHEAAAADVAGIDVGHRHRKAGRYGRIDRVAAAAQDILRDVRRIRIRYGDGGLSCIDTLVRRRRGWCSGFGSRPAGHERNRSDDREQK